MAGHSERSDSTVKADYTMEYITNIYVVGIIVLDKRRDK